MAHEKIISIDILKCIAAIFITNSHMEILYHPYEIFATGGAIGDVLFFFCSGFTLFMGSMLRFDNWYKKRINRIYPTVFAWAIISAFFFGIQSDMKFTIIHGGGWFVTCIMIYYVILFFIRKFVSGKLKLVFVLFSLISIIWYILLEREHGYNMYGNTYYKWCHYFLFMLLGAIIGISHYNWKFKFKSDMCKLIGCIVTYYLILIAKIKIVIIEDLQIISLIPLLLIVVYFYKVCNSSALEQCYKKKYIGWGMKLISGLCLEIYLVQTSLFTPKMNVIFPFNIPIMFIIIVIVAYIVRCVSKVFLQTFRNESYDWKAIFAPI